MVSRVSVRTSRGGGWPHRNRVGGVVGQILVGVALVAAAMLLGPGCSADAPDDDRPIWDRISGYSPCKHHEYLAYDSLLDEAVCIPLWFPWPPWDPPSPPPVETEEDAEEITIGPGVPSFAPLCASPKADPRINPLSGLWECVSKPSAASKAQDQVDDLERRIAELEACICLEPGPEVESPGFVFTDEFPLIIDYEPQEEKE